eukprot:g3057.t1
MRDCRIFDPKRELRRKPPFNKHRKTSHPYICTDFSRGIRESDGKIVLKLEYDWRVSAADAGELQRVLKKVLPGCNSDESLYQQDDLLVPEPHQGHIEIEDAPQETACTPILRKQDAAKRNVPEVDAWRERVENPPSPIPLRDPVEVAHVTEALTSIGEESEKKQGSVQYKEERRRSLENWTKGTVGRAFGVFGLSPSRKAAEKVGGRNLFGGGRTRGNENQPTSVEQEQEVDEFATPGDIKQQHSVVDRHDEHEHRHHDPRGRQSRGGRHGDKFLPGDTPHPGPPSTEDESQDVIDKTVSSIELGEDDAILAGGRASEVRKVDSTNTNASVRIRDSQATASTISSAERSCSSTSTSAGRGAGGGVTVPVYNYEGGGGSTLGKIAMRFRESVVALPVFSRVLRMREARAVEEGKRDKIGTVVHWSGKTASERAKGPGPSFFSGLYDALSGVFGAGGARGMLDKNGTSKRTAAAQNFQPGPGEGVPENSPARSPLFHRLGITSPSKKNSRSSPAVRFANNTLLTSASSPNLGSGSLFKDPSFDDFDFEHFSGRELSSDERYRILLLRNSEEAKKRRQQQNDHRMIESLVKQQAAADKLNPQFRMYRVVCVILSVWFVVACFFLVYAGVIYFTEVVPHLRSTYNEFGAGFRIESQFVHFLEESAFDVVETINHAVQLGFYKEPLYFDQLESFVTPSLVHRRAGVKQLEIGFLGTRLPVVDHGILFRKIGSPASGIQHFVMQSDMYPSCLAIGAFGCVDDLRIPSRDWYKKLAPIRFENLFFVYPIDPLVTFTSSSPAAPWDQGLSSLADGAIAMNEWKWFRYVLSAGSGSGRGLSVDEWRLAYEECRAAGVRGEFCNGGSVGGNGIFGDVLEVGGAGNANGTSSASMAAGVSVGSTTDQTSNSTTSNKNSSGGSTAAAGGAVVPTATTIGNATGDLLNATTTSSTRQPTTSTSTLTAPTYPELVEGCFSHYQVSQPYLYMHFANDKSEYLSPVTQPPESCYTGPRPSAKWEPEEISKEHAFLKSQKWQRQIYFEWEGPSFISTTETQGPLSSETFDFAPAVGLIFKLQFPEVPIPEEQQKLNLADMVVSHLVGKVSVDLTGCSKFLRDTYVDYVTRNDRDARGVASTDNGEYFDALIVNRQGEIVCARDIMSQVARRGGGSRKSGLRFRYLWEKFPDVGLESAQWAKIVQRLDFASPLPAHSGGEMREEGQPSARSRKRRAQETAVGGSRFQQDESVYNLAIPPPGGSFAGPDSEAHDAHVRDAGGFDDDSFAVANLLPKDGSFQVHRVRHSRMAGFYVVTRLDDAVFLSSSTSAVFVALIILGILPWFLNCCCVLCCFVMREQAVKLKQKKRDKALDEATRTQMKKLKSEEVN